MGYILELTDVCACNRDGGVFILPMYSYSTFNKGISVSFHINFLTLAEVLYKTSHSGQKSSNMFQQKDERI
jgi:hypothetical protein